MGNWGWNRCSYSYLLCHRDIVVSLIFRENKHFPLDKCEYFFTIVNYIKFCTLNQNYTFVKFFNLSLLIYINFSYI